MMPSEPTLVKTGTVILEYDSNTFTFNSSPEYQDVQELQQTRIYRETRGKTLDVFADPIWPNFEVLRYTFRRLTLAEKNDYLAFILLSLGQEVTLTDFEGREYVGFITNTTPNIVTEKDDNCSFRVELEFQGVLT